MDTMLRACYLDFTNESRKVPAFLRDLVAEVLRVYACWRDR